MIETGQVKKQHTGNHIDLWLIGIYATIGLIGNCVYAYAHSNHPANLGGVVSIGVSALTAMALAIVSLSVRRYGLSLRDIGFTLGRGSWVSLALVLLTYVCVSRGDLVTEHIDFLLPVAILQAASEELVFRVILIDRLMALLGKHRAGILASVTISSLAFTLAHVPLPDKDVPALIGLFVSSVLAAYIYVWTRSALFPVFGHVLSNTYATYGVWGGAVTIVAYYLLALWSRIGRIQKPIETDSDRQSTINAHQGHRASE